MAKKLLLTGFEPFGGHAINPSAELVRDLSWLKLPSGTDTVTALLPVDYGKAWPALMNKVLEVNPDIVISLGQAGGRKDICVERIGINWMEDKSDQVDALGSNAQISQRILENGPDALFATLPVEEMVAKGKSEKLPVEISNTAGTYLCNFVLYRLLEFERYTSRKCGFIHLPFLPEQLSDERKTKVAWMTLDQQKKALAVLLNAALQT